ncbi:MAG: hypothetical protein ACEQSQ_06110 [Candidatus Paceibacteria bacterium]
MKILNLVDLAKSDIKYKISKFPDGQQNITIINMDREWHNAINGKGPFHIPNYEIQIKSRLNNFRDLEIIIAAVACLRELEVKEIHLFAPYFVGARSDRKFEEGGNWYLKQVICPIINSLNFTSVTVLDAHSSVLGNLLNNFKGIDNYKLLEFGLSQIFFNKPYKDISIKNHFNDFILVSPDAGASHKIYKLAEAIGYKGDIITCSKERDIEGKLTRTVVPFNIKNVENKDFIIIDDICDGGRTFINIADNIKQNGLTKNKIYLIVTHGIFSAGFSELNKYFDGIYCTNSYLDIGDKAMINGELQITNVTQLNVF